MKLDFLYDLTSPEDLIEIYMEYVLNQVHDSIVDLTVLREYLGGFKKESIQAHAKRLEEMHATKDRLYEIFLVTGNDQILDFIFRSLDNESFEEVERNFNLLLDTLRIVFKDLGTDTSERCKRCRRNIRKNWYRMGHDIGQKATAFFHTEVDNLMQFAQ